MAANKTKSKEELFQRRKRVSELYLKGHSMAEIAEIIGNISAVMVYHDICWAREQWRTSCIDSIAQLKQRELGRIDHLEIEAYRGWQRSCKPALIEHEKSGNRPGDQGGPYDERSTERKHQAGDPRFLTIVGSCIESRRKILGLDAPAQVQMSGLDDVAAILMARAQRQVSDPPALRAETVQ